MIDPSFSVLTVTPDLLAQDLLPALLRALDDLDVRVVGALPYRFIPPAAAMLYGGRITHARRESRLHSAWLNPRLFLAGASLILFLRGDPAHGALVERICAAKGGSRIGEDRAGKLRGLSPLTDRGFSLVHSPDDRDGVAHELRVTLGPRAIARVLDATRPPLDAAVLGAVLPSGVLADEPHPFDVLPRTVAQIASLCRVAPMPAAVAPAAAALFDRAQRVRASLRDRPIDGALEPALWAAMATLAPPVAALAAAQRTDIAADLAPSDARLALDVARLLAAAATACDPAAFAMLDCEALLQSLEICNLPVREWDGHRLRLIAAYHRLGAD